MLWLDQLITYAQDQLSDRQRELFWQRGVSDEQIDLYRLGTLNKVLPEGLPRDFMEWVWEGRRVDDVFVFPLTNTLGEVKGLQFRHTDQERTGYSDYFAVRDEPVFFGLHQAMASAWEHSSVWLVEGAFDLFPVQRVLPNVISTITARLTKGLSQLLRRVVEEIWFGYDMDDKGREAALKAAHFEQEHFRIHIIRWPCLQRSDGRLTKDPSEVWELWGDQKFGEYVRNPKEIQWRKSLVQGKRSGLLLGR